ncbi:unnamed protein product, partial [Musa acuminata subsp. burmannicoides]
MPLGFQLPQGALGDCIPIGKLKLLSHKLDLTQQGEHSHAQVRIRTEVLFGMSHPGSSGQCCLAPSLASRDGDHTEVPSRPSRINHHVEPACDRPS